MQRAHRLVVGRRTSRTPQGLHPFGRARDPRLRLQWPQIHPQEVLRPIETWRFDHLRRLLEGDAQTGVCCLESTTNIYIFFHSILSSLSRLFLFYEL